MKTSFKNIALLVAATFPFAAIAEITSAHSFVVGHVESLVTLFALLVLGLTLGSEYSHPRRRSLCAMKAETHRLAA
jgi:hypothetical protein